LAAQINNDNLVIFWIALSMWLLIKWRLSVSLNHPSLPLFLLAGSAALLGAMSQYVFLPLLAFVGIMLTYDAIKLLAKRRPFVTGLSGRTIASTSVACVSIILFLASYGANLVNYHTPVPSCDRVLTTEQCLSYYTFNRNYTAEHTNPPVNSNPITFTAGWLYRLYTTSFYTVLNGPSAPLQVPPFPLPAIAAGILLLVSALLFAVQFNALRRQHPQLLLVLGAAVFFTAILWLHNYQDFIHLRQKVGINGRYLLLVTPFIMIAGALALRERLINYPKIMVGLLVLVGLCFMQGGGVINYMVVSDTNWWWPSPVTRATASVVKRVLSPIVIRFPLFW
jgi:hypothetical protein